MRIKTKTGEVIDLAQVRAIVSAGNGREEAWVHIEILNDYTTAILDALEAVVSVPELAHNAHSDSNRIPNAEKTNARIGERNRTIREIRQAAGVIEGEAAHVEG